jgi:outer membrane protein assembly factor BamD (BamD/ComL family)
MEVESLDRVRKALAASDPPAALRELGAFSARFPSAALAPEATVLRVQALLESGNRHAAERLARRFIAASPGSPHAARVRLLIDGSARPKARFD